MLLFVPRERYDDRPARSGPARSWPRPSAAGSRPTIPASPTRRWRGSTTSSASPPAPTPIPDLADAGSARSTAAGPHLGRPLSRPRCAPSCRPGRRRRVCSPLWREAFPAGYRDRYDAAEALDDLVAVEALAGEAAVARARLPLGRRHARGSSASSSIARGRSGAAGRRAADPGQHGPEGPGRGRLPHPPRGPLAARATVWVHEFLLEDERGERLSFDGHARRPSRTPSWRSGPASAENDGFNRLVLELGVSWREAALIRALARYRQQSGLDPSQAVQAAGAGDHPDVARLILDLFRAAFDPGRSAATSKSAQDAGRRRSCAKIDRGPAGRRQPGRRPGAAPPGRPGQAP